MSDRLISKDALGHLILTACGTFKSVRPISITLGLILAMLVVVDGFRDDDWEDVVNLLPAILLIWLVGVGAIFTLVRFMRVRVFSKGIEGRSFGGFRRRFLWDQIAGVRFDSSSGLPAVVIIEKDTKKEIWMLREIIEQQEFQLALSPYIDWRELEVFD